MYLIFRGLFFSHNDEIGQKDHSWMGTNYKFTAMNRKAQNAFRQIIAQ